MNSKKKFLGVLKDIERGKCMNIDNISTISSKGNFANRLKNVKSLNVPLKDGKTARFTTADNYLECLVTKGDNIVEGYGKYSSKGITSKDIWGLYEKFQSHIKDGIDFFKEFTKAILS